MGKTGLPGVAGGEAWRWSGRDRTQPRFNNRAIAVDAFFATKHRFAIAPAISVFPISIPTRYGELQQRCRTPGIRLFMGGRWINKRNDGRWIFDNAGEDTPGQMPYFFSFLRRASISVIFSWSTLSMAWTRYG